MMNFDGTPALQIKEWFLKEDDFEFSGEEVEIISLSSFSVAETIEKDKKLIGEK